MGGVGMAIANGLASGWLPGDGLTAGGVMAGEVTAGAEAEEGDDGVAGATAAGATAGGLFRTGWRMKSSACNPADGQAIAIEATNNLRNDAFRPSMANLSSVNYAGSFHATTHSCESVATPLSTSISPLRRAP